MEFSVVTIFPEMFDSFLAHGIIRRAIEDERIHVSAVDIRDYAQGKHRVTDDRPYGGGCGMVMKPEPLSRAIAAAKKQQPEAETILLSPQGKPFDQHIARSLATCEGLVFVCGRYEGIDERVYAEGIDHELSIGDYVMTGGELAAMVIIDAVTRLIPGVLGGADSAEKDSFSDGLLEHAHYTRPHIFENEAVPDILLSGNHKEIDDWRLESALIRTFLKRPDLLESRGLSHREKMILRKWGGYLDKLCAD